MRSKFILRVRLLSGMFILFAAVLVTRLYFVQIVHGEEFRAKAIGQYIESAQNSEHRGDIFFTRKDGTAVAAAVMEAGWKIAIRPSDIASPDATFEALSSIITLDRDRFFASAAKKNDPYEDISFRVDDEAAQAIRERELAGVIMVRDEWRTYPGKDLAAHAIGFVGYNGPKREGVYGIEKYYEDTLRRDGGSLFVNPFAEIFTNIAAAISKEPGNYEGNVITSIDPDAEVELERVLAGIVKEYSPRTVGGVVMDPATGEIVALGVLPDFDPNTYNTEEDPRIFSNPIVESRYEMGSIMKPLTMAAGLDAGAIALGTTYDDKGYIIRSGKRISNFDGKGRGVVPMQEILNQSLNTGAAFVAERMGHETFAKYFGAYGLGEETGIDLPNEIAGDISSITERGAADVDFASASFGQGIAITPIAMIRALGSLANGGVLPEPHVATHIQYPSGIVRETPQAPKKRVLKQETAETVTNMLVKVFDEALLHGELKQEHYSIAAKTGTAQIGGPGCDGYCPGRFLHSFFGYFPAHDPRFIILLYQVEPQGVQYASQSLARPFMELAKFLINYYDIPPDR